MISAGRWVLAKMGSKSLSTFVEAVAIPLLPAHLASAYTPSRNVFVASMWYLHALSAATDPKRSALEGTRLKGSKLSPQVDQGSSCRF